MAIKHLDYKAVPRSRRKQQAARAIGKMRELLQFNPVATPEQREAVEGKIQHMQRWINGDLDPGPPPVVSSPKNPKKVAKKPVVVVVEEKMGVDDGAGDKKKKDKKKDKKNG